MGRQRARRLVPPLAGAPVVASGCGGWAARAVGAQLPLSACRCRTWTPGAAPGAPAPTPGVVGGHGTGERAAGSRQLRRGGRLRCSPFRSVGMRRRQV